MSITVQMPRMGESVTEGTVERWLVAEGDGVEKDQVLCEVTTDKIDAEVPAPESGVVSRILVSEGTTVNVGDDLIEIDPQGEPVKRSSSSQEAESEEETDDDSSASAPGAGSASPRVSPLARRMAKDRGVDLDRVEGSGPGGRVTKADVLAASDRTSEASEKSKKREPASAGAQAAQAEPGTLGAFLSSMRIPRAPVLEGDQVVPFSAIRRKIAEHMVVSKIVSPHVGTLAEVDLHGLVALRNAEKRRFQEAQGFGLTYLPFIVAATVRGLKRFRRMNATVGDQVVIERAGIHVGVAVNTERGLVVPVVRDADHLSVVGLARAIEDLATRARERQLSADDLQGGTFTVSNPGREGNLYGFAVINQPQVGILRMGEIRKRAVVVERDGEDTIVIRPMMYLALSYDHRIIDGATGNSFLYAVARELEAADFEL